MTKKTNSLFRKHFASKSTALAMAIAYVAAGGSLYRAHAEETAGEKVGNTADEAAAHTKQMWRKGKKKTRDATGNHDARKDSAEKIETLKEKGSNAIDRAKDKVD